MAIILILGAIPSGLAGTVTNVGGLYVIRFFIGILGATFVPCLAWTTAFYDKSIVGMANSFAGGWGCVVLVRLLLLAKSATETDITPRACQQPRRRRDVCRTGGRLSVAHQ